MVLPGESTVPDHDEVRLLKSGRILVRLEGDREFVLRRPKFGELRHLMERFDEINDEVFEPAQPGQKRRTSKEGQDTLSVGGRWWSEVLAALGPSDPPTLYDNKETPAWAVQSDVLFGRFFRHWTEVPLVSDVGSPEPQLAPVTAMPMSEPTILRQVIPGSGGP